MRIPLSRPDISDKEIKYVTDVLRTPYLSLGKKLGIFEKKVADYIGVKYAVAVNSGTSALHLIIRALGIKDGDEVITTPFSFVASANCILFERATPIFVDIKMDSLNIDPELIEKSITKKTKAILAVDVFGHPAEWDKLEQVAKKYDLKLIEDSCEALGAQYNGRKTGTFGNAAAFAFYPNKQITTGEGGVIATKSKRIADLCRSMRNQGRSNRGGWLNHVRIGYNYRISDINCALGIAQIERLKSILRKRGKVANMYNERLKGFPEIEIPHIGSGVKISWFVYVIRLKNSVRRNQRDKIMVELRRRGIECNSYFSPIHLQPFYVKMFAYKRSDFPVTERISETTIALPFYNNITEEQIEYITTNLENILKGSN